MVDQKDSIVLPTDEATQPMDPSSPLPEVGVELPGCSVPGTASSEALPAKTRDRSVRSSANLTQGHAAHSVNPCLVAGS